MKNYIKVILLVFISQNIFANTTNIDTVPQTQNFGHASTSWDDFKIASPSDNIPMIKAPEPSKTGDATLSFPIKLPEARAELTPTLNITYSSEAGTSWLGKGWDLSLSSFTLDTRWGVPRYSIEKESEIYLFDGAQMGPVFHRSVEYPRETDREFHLRQEQAFQKIIRIGSTPSNYSWEVRDKDGTHHYYGSSSNSQLKTASGQGTEWHISETRDANDNYIQYTYQTINKSGGKMIYPERVSYNGHGNTVGKYLVEFKLKNGERNDAEISYRTGMRRVVADLLGEIIISYDGQIIRTYQLNYIVGAFEKTLLSSISEYDQNGAFFYEYKFEYYDDVRDDGVYQPFGDEVTWSVPNDAVEFSSISGSVDGFNSQPTVLGGAKSWSIGGGLAITIGPPFNPACKDNSVGPNGGYVNTNSTGLTALVDIDGDGLPDKVWKEDGKIYYRPNLHSVNNPIAGFGIKREISGITDFSKARTGTWNVGAEINLLSFFGGYSREEGTTTISTYLADFNGDDLIDIGSDGKVYFNSLTPEGYPTFTQSSGDTPSPIFKGEPLDPNFITTDPNAQAELEAQFPTHDVVRMWRAPKSGNIAISGDVQLIEDTSSEASTYETADGVRVSIQVGDFERWVAFIDEDDYNVKTPTGVNNIFVTTGQRIYFRVNSRFDGAYDEVSWDPIIIYVNEDLSQVDANCLPKYVYQASKDFLVSSEGEITIPNDGIITIDGEFVKPILTDSIRILVEGSIHIDTVFAPKDIHTGNLTFTNLEAIAGSKLKFSIAALTNVDWAKIKWTPTITYSNFSNGNPTTDTNGDPIISICPPVDYQAFKNSTLDRLPFVVPANGTIELHAVLDDLQAIFFDYQFSASIKTKNEIDSNLIIRSMKLPVTDISIDSLVGVDIRKVVYEGDTIFIDFFLDNLSLINVDLVYKSTGQTDSTLTYNVHSPEVTDDKNAGHLYRGWGQFIYNSQGGFDNLPILTGELAIDTNGVAEDTLLIGEDTPEEDLEGGNLDADDKFIVMRPDLKSSAWRGSDASIFLTGNTISSSRNGNKYPDASFNTAQGGDGFPALNLITKYSSDAIGAGAAVGPGSLGAGRTTARSWTVFDITDMNGDRYPDYVTQDSIQYTNPRGGLVKGPKIHRHIFDREAHYSTSEGIGGGIGGSYVSSGAKNSGSTSGTGGNRIVGKIKNKVNKALNKARNAFKSANAAIGISGNFTSDNDEAEISFLDINGDGLEDKIRSNGDVAFNIGYGFSNIENWSFSEIRKGNALDYGGGLGFSICNNSIAGGISVSRTENNSSIGFMDINGDALLDQVVSIDPYMVRINKGNGFGDPVEWFDKDVFDAGASIGESINGAGTICAEFLFFRICFNVSAFSGQGSSGVHDAFVDIDGDGYSDFLIAKNNDGYLKVRSSNIKRTNLLSLVEGPMDLYTKIDYELAGNTQNIPFSKWVMNSLEVFDGVVGDGENFQLKTFEYSNPIYDRHERQFYGFEEVKEHHLANDQIVRSVISEYHTENYLLKGLLKKKSLVDANGKLFQETIDQYEIKEIETGGPVPPSVIDSDLSMGFVSLQSREIKYYGRDNTFLSRTNHYLYDQYGNIIQEIDADGAGYTRTIDIDYHYKDDQYMVNKPAAERISVAGEILRNTEYEIDERGNRIQIRSQIESQKFAITDMTYDAYGNVLVLSKPENHLGQRMTFTNTYDAIENQYLVSEIDGYGYESTYTYEPLHNQMISSTDINGNITTYSVDAKGRPSSITYPIEIAAGLPYSIQFEYLQGTNLPYAVARHYDPEDGSTLDVYHYEDGLQRSIQTKTLASLSAGANSNTTTGLIVSGTDKYDHLGRMVDQHQPLTESLNTATSYSDDTENTIRPISTLYDILDRPIQITEVDTGVTLITYDISADDTGATYFSVHTVDALGNSKTEYYNTRGEIVSQRFDSPDGDIWTHYIYDGMGQVTHIVDALSNTTAYTYDMLGRRITLEVPDAGLTELRYDNANNLTERITATIRDVISTDGSIRYTYDKERLIQIDYPKYFQNKVQIHYGSAQDSFNRVGRIWLQEDGTGGREYFYDANGNPTKMIRTMMINRSKVYTYVSENEYDTWSRIKSMKYADGEEVVYSYLPGGQLKSMIGQKASVTYPYLTNAGYDKYVDRIFLAYGNGTQDIYSYDKKGRLQERKLTGGDNTLLSHERYTYDLMDNVKSRNNTGNGYNGMGGNLSETFEYDNLYRMSMAQGHWMGDQQQSYDLFFDYDPLNNLTMKGQNHEIDNQSQILTSRTFDYQYEDPTQPTRPSEVGGRTYAYDPNGNLLLSNSAAIFDYDQNFFDEENRMLGHSNNGYISRYTYDAFGRRAIKSHGESQGVFINGAPAGFVEHKLNFKATISPYFAAYAHDYRKHYFIDDMRIATKIGTGVFQTTLGDGPEITAGGIDYKTRIQAYENSLLDYYASLGVPPGPPTLLALLGQPEINTTSLPDATTNDPYSTPPSNWPMLPPPDSLGPPGVPVFYEQADINRENVMAGYNFTAGAITAEAEQFFYHYDHTESTQYVTDYNGNPRQFATYFPSGERWIHRKTGIDSTIFFFNGLELDDESGMYYMGEVYYNPITNIEQSVDPVLQNFGQATFQNRPEGTLYYDFAELADADETDFDPELLNAEKPDIIVNNAVNVIIPHMQDPKPTRDQVFREENLGLWSDTSPQDTKDERRKFSFSPTDTDTQSMIQEVNDLLEFKDVLQFNDNSQENSIRSADRFRKFKKKVKKTLKKEKKRKEKLKKQKGAGFKVRFKVR